MNTERAIKKNIENALKNFDEHSLREATTELLNTLGYYSKRVGRDDIDIERFNRLIESAIETTNPSKKLHIEDWHSYYQIMQVADDEIRQRLRPDQQFLFESTEIDDALRTSYMFVVVQLSKNTYTRTQLADITRFINKEYEKPIMMIFRYGDVLSLGIINRRHHKRDKTKQVLEKVTLIKDIKLDDPKRAHIDIVSDLHLRRLIENQGVNNFDTLHKAWEGILNTEPLNKKFYKEIYEWYQWAVAECEFPDEDDDMQVIRMITRLLFIWFLKEKDLVPEDIFDIDKAEALLNNFSMESSDYYQAVLQNLFFATLNTPINERAFSRRNSSTHRDASKYRYNDLLQNPNGFLEHLKQVPFVNGGLFDCLDTFEATRDGGERIDCFTDNENDRRKLQVPAKLFYQEDQEDKGIFEIFSHYKFTVEENTPVEQEVALDPELLGQVFENLLGAYNPETRITARRATGSYYTPRQIVNYMVDEALIAYFLQKVKPYDNDKKDLEDRLRDDLLAYNQQGKIENPDDHLIHQDEILPMIEAINDFKIIDPAVGTGAFPMGILNKFVLILRKLDPQNEHWKYRQLTQAEKIDDPESKESAKKAIEQVFSETNRYNDYGRKLYLIQNCIYGVDIQPIATTIAKLRFFISLIIEQGTNDNQNANYGIRPLPNLETKFVAANTLIGLKELMEPECKLFLENEDILQLRQEIAALRSKHFNANTRHIKLGYIKQEKECREQLAETLAAKHAEWHEQIQNRIEQQVENSQLSSEQAQQELREELQEEYAVHEAKLAAGLEEAKRIAHWDAYNQNAVAEFFDAEWMFGVKDGFDVVIGNPPYIQLQKENGRLANLYQDVGFDTFARTGDIYCLFYEKAHQLLENKGHACLITSNKWMRAGYGKNLRVYFVTLTQPIQLLDMGPDVFDATVDTNILLFQNTCFDVPTAFRAVSLGANFDKQTGNISRYLIDNGVSMEMPAKGKPWAVLSSAELAIRRKIEKIGKPLKDWNINIYRGVTTGYNDAFIISETKRNELVTQNAKSAEIIRPLLRGKDIKCYSMKWADLWLIYVRKGTEIQHYPAILNHLQEYQDTLSRKAGRNECRTYAFL
ncbi:MAG: Eco57I restriction-modification methylase domain-containing protein [Candidatus Poribacteria bacterium]|nr:Eco57I restriction-modification methylase domain-containing protein [Candidatus Poribacteria bacterium]